MGLSVPVDVYPPQGCVHVNDRGAPALTLSLDVSVSLSDLLNQLGLLKGLGQTKSEPRGMLASLERKVRHLERLVPSKTIACRRALQEAAALESAAVARLRTLLSEAASQGQDVSGGTGDPWDEAGSDSEFARQAHALSLSDALNAPAPAPKRAARAISNAPVPPIGRRSEVSNAAAAGSPAAHEAQGPGEEAAPGAGAGPAGAEGEESGGLGPAPGPAPGLSLKEADAAETAAAEALRSEGNNLYKEAQELDSEILRDGGDPNTVWPTVVQKYEMAALKYTAGINISPQSPRLWNNRALCYAGMRNWRQCRGDALRATTLKPDYGKGWFLLAMATWKEGRATVALQHLEVALTNVPKDKTLLALQGEIKKGLQEKVVAEEARARETEEAAPKSAPESGEAETKKPGLQEREWPAVVPPKSAKNNPPEKEQAADPAGDEVAKVPARLVVRSSHPTIGNVVAGTYKPFGANHGRVTYRKEDGVRGFKVLIYYWDGRDGPENCGWWFGLNEVGNDKVWAYHPGSDLTPPPADWHVPHDGDVDPNFSITESDAEANSHSWGDSETDVREEDAEDAETAKAYFAEVYDQESDSQGASGSAAHGEWKTSAEFVDWWGLPEYCQRSLEEMPAQAQKDVMNGFNPKKNTWDAGRLFMSYLRSVKVHRKGGDGTEAAGDKDAQEDQGGWNYGRDNYDPQGWYSPGPPGARIWPWQPPSSSSSSSYQPTMADVARHMAKGKGFKGAPGKGGPGGPGKGSTTTRMSDRADQRRVAAERMSGF